MEIHLEKIQSMPSAGRSTDSATDRLVGFGCADSFRTLDPLSGQNSVCCRSANRVTRRVRDEEENSKSAPMQLSLECLTTLYRALIYSPLNPIHIPTLFFLSETILYWLKNDAVLEPFLTSTELKLLKVHR
jgi:hypothetical protein